MDFKAWAIDTAVRAVKTFAQALMSLFGFQAFNVLKGVDWKTDLGIAAGAALISVLHNVQSLKGPQGETLPVAPSASSVASQAIALAPVAAAVDLGVTPDVHPDGVTPDVTPDVTP